MTFYSNIWDVETCEAFLAAIEQRFLTGPIIRVKIGGKETEYDTSKMNLAEVQAALLAKLHLLDPANHPGLPAQRGGVTQSVFQ